MSKLIGLDSVTYDGETFLHGSEEQKIIKSAVSDSSGQSQYHKVTAHALVDSADSVRTFVQPANTLLSRIWLVCTSAPTIATGDIGFEVGTSSSDAQIVATSSDTILDGGTTIAAGKGIPLALVAHGDASAGLYGSAAARTLYLNITATTNASVQGEFMWIIETIDTSKSYTNNGTLTTS